MKNPLITVISCVYNHEQYVTDMLEGFLRQDTDFDVEYLIHDDASTDKTPDILKSYQDKYPGKFTVVYQTENQYQKQIKIAQQILLPMAKGKYVAFCEGDDYWIDKNKLKEQVYFLENNPAYVCVAHNALIWDCTNNKIIAQNNCECSRDLNEKDVFLRKWPSIATASRVFRKDAATLSGFFLDCGMVGDVPTDFYAFTKGKIYYIDKIMCVYRYRSKGSWTERTVQKFEQVIEWCIIRMEFLKRYNKYTDYKYDSYINSYMSRGVHDVLDILIDQSIPQAKLLEVLNILSAKYDHKYDENEKEIERQANILIYGDECFIERIKTKSEKNEIYIYGAGKFGKSMEKLLAKYGVTISGFLVSNNYNDFETTGEKIICIDDYDNKVDQTIIVAIGAKIWDEIHDILKDNQIKNYEYPLLVKES